MATIYKANGQVVDNYKPKNGKTFELSELQEIVGGYIEIVNLRDGRMMVLNEEGKMYGLAINNNATKIFNKGFSYAYDVIVGDVLVTEPNYID